MKRIPTSPRFVWHFANAYDTESGGIAVDLVAYDDFSSNEMLATLPTGAPRGEIKGRLTRVSIERHARAASTTIR